MSKLAHSNEETMAKIEENYNKMSGDEPPTGRARARGVGRSSEDQRTLLVALDRIPTDDDIRRIHDALR